MLKPFATPLIILAFLGALVALGLSSPASAASSLPTGISSWSESQALTRAAPSTSSTDGISLGGQRGAGGAPVKAFRLTACAVSGQAITGGTINFWVQDKDGLWAINPTLAQTLSSTGQRCQVVGGDWEVLVPNGRFLPAASSVTVSGGTTVTLKIEATIQ
jgi:hypothetical protein